MTSRYRVFGLSVLSELELPELARCEDAVSADVIVTTGSVDSTIASAGLHAAGADLVFVAEDVARFQISSGARIVVDPVPGADPRNVRLFLLGSAFGALLHQRGLLPLHANAVEVDGKAFAFMGESGAGKSTLAAWFHDHGYRVLADDVCVVGIDDDQTPRAYPGVQRLRLWSDALEAAGHPADELSRSYVTAGGSPDKFDFPVKPSSVARSPLPIGGLYVLDQGDRFHIQPLPGLEGAEAIIANTYRGSYLAVAGTVRQHWQSAVDLARRVPVCRLSRSKRFDEFDDECRSLLRYLSEVAARL